MQIAVMVAGAIAEFLGWWLVSTGRFDVWKLMPVVLGSMGVTAVIVRPPVAAQGTAMQRTGRVHLRKSDGEIWVGGDVVDCIKGEIHI